MGRESPEHDGASNTWFRQVRTASCILFYILFGGLYCLRVIDLLEGVPIRPYMVLGNKVK